MAIKKDTHTQGFESFFSWRSSDHRALHLNIKYTAFFNSTRRPAHTSSLFHARAMQHRSSAGDIAMSQQLSAKSSNPIHVFAIHAERCSRHIQDCPTQIRCTRITLWHRTRTTYSRRECVVKLNVRFRLPVLSIHAATNTGGTFRASIASMIR